MEMMACGSSSLLSGTAVGKYIGKIYRHHFSLKNLRDNLKDNSHVIKLFCENNPKMHIQSTLVNYA